MDTNRRKTEARLLLEHAGNDAMLLTPRINLDERGVPSCVDVEEVDGTLLLSPDARKVLEDTLLSEDTK